MEATLTRIGVTDARPAQFALAAAAAVLRAVRQMGAAILAGSDHPVFRTPDSASSLVLASRTEQNRLLDAGFYVDPDSAREALRERGQFNAVDPSSGWKADFIIRADAPFDSTEFARRQAVNMLGTDLYVATPEDTIISKLRWARAGQSERQLRDVVGIVQISGSDLDTGYIEKWVHGLDLDDAWAQVRAMAE